MAAMIGFLAAGLALLITVPEKAQSTSSHLSGPKAATTQRDRASHLSGLVGQRT